MVLDLPALTTPLPKKTLCMYLAASEDAVSAVLLVVRQGRQRPVHYVSRTLHDAERNYAPLKKLALALRHAARRLRRYFEAHPITVITDQPIKQVLNKADTFGSAIKGQILVDFINEVPVGREVIAPQQAQYTVDHQKDCKEEWVLYTDGASSAKGSGVGMVLSNPTKTEYTYALRLNFECTNNQAEYEALLAGLRIAQKMGVQSLSVNVDSKLNEDRPVRHGRRGVVQAALSNAYALVCRPTAGQLCHPGDPHGGVQHASESKISGGKSNQARLLLANNASGCEGGTTQMRLMPDPLFNSQASYPDDLNHGTLYILLVGNGCAWATT
ncbi:reverse transcriptase domain-containing protein [Tanacetum coccineum]